MTLACAELARTSAPPVVVSYRIAVATNLIDRKGGMICLGPQFQRVSVHCGTWGAEMCGKTRKHTEP